MESTTKIWFKILALLHTLFLHKGTIYKVPWSNRKGGGRKLQVINENMFFCILSVKHVKQKGPAVKSLFQMNSVEHIQHKPHIYMTQRESVMMTKISGFPSITNFGFT